MWLACRPRKLHYPHIHHLLPSIVKSLKEERLHEICIKSGGCSCQVCNCHSLGEAARRECDNARFSLPTCHPATPSVAVRVQCVMQSDLRKEPGRSPSHICVVLAYGAITPRRGSGGCILNLVCNHTRVFPPYFKHQQSSGDIPPNNSHTQFHNSSFPWCKLK